MAHPREDKLEPALTFLRELWALDHALGSTSKRMLDRMGITGPQRMVLRFVGKFPGISGGELAALLHLEKSTLSLTLSRLEERGLIVREVGHSYGIDNGLRISIGSEEAMRGVAGILKALVKIS